MFYWDQEIFVHSDDLNNTPVILGQDEYCSFGQVVAQPVITIGKLCIAVGKQKRSWIDCFKKIKG